MEGISTILWQKGVLKFCIQSSQDNLPCYVLGEGEFCVWNYNGMKFRGKQEVEVDLVNAIYMNSNLPLM